MQYSDLITALGALLVVPITNASSATPSSNTDFNNFLPWITQSAEQRIYREIDFLATREEDCTTTLSTATRKATLPASIIVLQNASVVTPVGATPDTPGATLHPVEIVSKDLIDSIWPQPLGTPSIPQYVAQLSATSVMVAPPADQAYFLLTTGIFRPAAISASNPTTYISTNYFDLLLYACMVIACGYQRDFGQQSDDPKIAMSWESMYQAAMKSVLFEDQRRKTQGTNWSPYSQTPLSAPRK